MGISQQPAEEGGEQPPQIDFWGIISIGCHGIVRYETEPLVNRISIPRTPAPRYYSVKFTGMDGGGNPKDTQVLWANNPTTSGAPDGALSTTLTTPRSLAVESTSNLCTVLMVRVPALLWFFNQSGLGLASAAQWLEFLQTELLSGNPALTMHLRPRSPTTGSPHPSTSPSPFYELTLCCHMDFPHLMYGISVTCEAIANQ